MLGSGGIAPPLLALELGQLHAPAHFTSQEIPPCTHWTEQKKKGLWLCVVSSVVTAVWRNILL
jgi:hypothetical protein